MKFRALLLSLPLLFSTSGLQDLHAAGAAGQPNICNRGCWSARAPKTGLTYMSGLNRAIVHHTADANHMNTGGLEDSKANVRGVQNYHMDVNGWADIGYHFLVDKYGHIFEGRHDSMSGLPKGAHDGTNANSFGFNVMGYFHPNHNQKPTDAMLNSLYNVIAWRMPNGWQPYGSPGKYGPLGNYVGYVDSHRRVKSTACPGDHVHNPYIGNDVNAGIIRDQIKRRIDGTLKNRVGMARTATGNGYWICASDGGVFSYGDAAFYGSMGGTPLNSPVVGMAARPQGDGYWLVASDGGIFCFGAAPFHGSMGGTALNQPIVGMACTANGSGYWMVAKDGGIFSFNAPFHGSLGGSGYTDIVGMATSFNNDGYWILRADGAVYSYGGAAYHGGANSHGRTDFIGMAARTNGGGYWLATANGAIYSYGSVNYKGGANELKFVGIAPGPSTYNGYWLVKDDGAIFSFGDAGYHGGAN